MNRYAERLALPPRGKMFRSQKEIRLRPPGSRGLYLEASLCETRQKNVTVTFLSPAQGSGGAVWLCRNPDGSEAFYAASELLED